MNLNAMNWLRKYIVLVISGAVAFVLLAAIGGRLFFVVKSYQKEKRTLADDKGNLDRLYNRDPFPVVSNIAKEKEKLDDLLDEYNELNTLLGESQIRPEGMEASKFLYLLGRVLSAMRGQLQAVRVVFPEKYAFGFEKYAGGQLPAAKDIPRLIQQLRITEQFCRVMNESALNELISFSRDEFELASESAADRARSGRQGPPQPPGAGASPADSGELYSNQHFRMAFRAKESSFIDFLNRLARLPMFTVVTWVEISNPRREVNFGAGAVQPAKAESKTSGKGPGEELSREKRIVFGKEEVEVRLEMDVYNFSPPIDYTK